MKNVGPSIRVDMNVRRIVIERVNVAFGYGKITPAAWCTQPGRED